MGRGSPPSRFHTHCVGVSDDLGIEHLQFYGVGDGPFADTPNLSAWAGEWLRFDDAWSNPECSPTRGTIQTGDYGFRTGIGRVVNDDTVWGLDTEPDTLLPKLLKDTGLVSAAYQTVALGKWHLGTNDDEGIDPPPGQPPGCTDPDPNDPGEATPIAAGYDWYEGVLLDQQQQIQGSPYFTYIRTSATPLNLCTEEVAPDPQVYLTNDIVDSFEEWHDTVRDPAKPWFAYVAFTAPHKPLHCPPDSIYGPLDCSTETKQYHAMIHALDVEVTRLLTIAGGTSGNPPTNPPNTLVVFASDNGSPADLAESPFAGFFPGHAKCTVYEGGVKVPLLVGGDMVTKGVVDPHRIVGLVDLYATALMEAGAAEAALPPSDSRPLQPYFSDPAAPGRQFLYTETFTPNFDPSGTLGPTLAQYAARTGRYKLIVINDFQKRAFYDLEIDPFEQDGPLDPDDLDPNQQQGLQDLVDYLTNQLLPPGGLLDICQEAKTGDPCDEADPDAICCGVCDTDLDQCVNDIPECGSQM